MHHITNKKHIVALSLILPLVVTFFSIHHLKDAPLIASFVLGTAMSIIVYTDAKHFIIPDIVSLPMIIVGILASAYLANQTSPGLAILYSSCAATFGFGIFYLVKILYIKLRNIDGLGMGDVKIAAVAGAWTGFSGLNAVLLVSCFSALAIILLSRLLGQKMTAQTAIPFGLFLAPAIWLVWFLQSTGYISADFQ